MNLKSKIGGMVLAVVLMGAVAGCATPETHINRDIVGKECVTREECLSFLNLPNPQNPDKIFVIEPTIISDTLRGKPPFYSNMRLPYNFYMDICLSKALSEEFPQSKIISGENHKLGEIYIYDFKNMIIYPGLSFSTVAKFNGEVRINGESKMVTAEGTARGNIFADSMMYRGSIHYSGFATMNACRDFAKKVKILINQDSYISSTSSN